MQWALVGVIIIGLLLRLTRVHESFWYDELAAWLEYGRFGPGAIVGNFFDPSNHVLHTLLSWCSITAFGESEAAFRLPALFASLGSIAGMCALGRAVHSWKLGLIAAGVMTISPISLLESVDARAYSLVICFSTIATWLMLRNLQANQPLVWFLYGIVASLAVWAHLLAAFLIVGHGLWLLMLCVVIRENKRRSYIAGMIAVVLATAMSFTLYSPIFFDIIHLLSNQNIATVESDAQPTLFGEEGWHLLLQLGGSWQWWAALPGLVLFCIGVALAMRCEQLCHATAFGLIGAFVYVGFVLITGTWVYARFALFALPGSLLLVAIAIEWLSSHNHLGKFAAIVVSLILAGCYVSDFFLKPPRQPIRDAVEFVAMQKKDSQYIAAIGLLHGVIRVYEPMIGKIETIMHNEELVNQIITIEVDTIIVLYPHLLDDATLRAISDRGFVHVATFRGWHDWGRGDVWVFQRE